MLGSAERACWARLRRPQTTHHVTLSDPVFDSDSELGRVVAAYGRWQGRTP